MASFWSKAKLLIIVGLFCLVGYIEAKKIMVTRPTKKVDLKNLTYQKTYGTENYIFEAITQKDHKAVLVWCKSNGNSIIRNQYKQTPLMIAVKDGHSKIIDCLLKYQSKTINALDDYDKTALDYAVELYSDKNTETTLINVKNKICKKLMSKKAKASDITHSELARNIMYPFDMKDFRECKVYTSKSLCGTVNVLQICDIDRYAESYLLNPENLNKEIMIRDSIQKENFLDDKIS